MELSRIQEEVLLAIASSKREMCEAEILVLLNQSRPNSWKKISQPSLNKTISRMEDKGLLLKARIEPDNYNRKFYQISETGTRSLSEAEENRNRLR